MSFQLIQRRLDFPALVVERGQLSGRRQCMVQDGSDQPIDGLGIGNPVQAIVDHAHHDRLAFIPPVGSGRVDAAAIGSVRQAPIDLQPRVPASPPQQIRSRCGGFLPQLVAGKEPVGQTQHPLPECGHDLFGQRQFIGGVLVHARRPQHMSSVPAAPQSEF
jgi:hypothetical protein